MTPSDPQSARTLVVAIDGPSGSGKSSVSRAVAGRLGLRYLDTGAMYRALTWWCLDQGIDLDDEAAVTSAASELPLVIGTDPADPRVVVAGTDVSSEIRTTAISSVVSKVARHLPARQVLIAAQRAAIEAGAVPGIVAEGRDITSVVAPDADLRLLITASQEARLARRAREVHGEADAAAVEATRDEVVRRDRDDSAVTAFLTPGEGVRLLDTTDLDFEQTVEAVVTAVRGLHGDGRQDDLGEPSADRSGGDRADQGE